MLVAGEARRLRPLTARRPKCLLEVGSRAIVDRQLDALDALGVREVCLVTGYLGGEILTHTAKRPAGPAVTHVVNPRFAETNTAASLYTARGFIGGDDFVLVNGDVLFDRRLLERVLVAADDGALAVERKPCGAEEVKVATSSDGRILQIGKHLAPARSTGEFIGVARFRSALGLRVLSALEQVLASGGERAYFEAALDRIAAETRLAVVDVTGLPCIEIDFPEDYAAACRDVLPRLIEARR